MDKTTTTTILVIEDDKPLVLWLKDLLQDDFTVLEAESFSLALEAIAGNDIDLVIAGARVNESLVTAFCHEVRCEQKSIVPILIMINTLDDEQVFKVFELGATDFLLKPLNFRELRVRIELALHRRLSHEKYVSMVHTIKGFKDQAEHDHLTTLYNRNVFDNYAVELITAAATFGTPLSVLMIDIDHFKKINDTYGHDAGDAVLRSFSDFLQETLRKEDLIVRYGGEEFVVFLADRANEQAFVVAEKLRERIQEHIFIEGEYRVNFTVSIGVSTFYSSGEEDVDYKEQLHIVLAEADKALYKAKNMGRDKVARIEEA
jgi:two-component system, cell cycle response regulator